MQFVCINMHEHIEFADFFENFGVVFPVRVYRVCGVMTVFCALLYVFTVSWLYLCG